MERSVIVRHRTRPVAVGSITIGGGAPIVRMGVNWGRLDPERRTIAVTSLASCR